ncbi:MAG TPA: hypothetical protein VGM67_11560 [Gemmatimonadaceae bacterium]|jgi:hypothetical protein
MKLLRSCRPILTLLLVAACERAKQPAPADSEHAAVAAASDTSASAASNSNWDESAGPVLLVAGESPASASVVVPDAAQIGTTLAAIPHPADVTLFGRGGTVQRAEIPTLDDSGDCTVASLDAAPPPRPWNVGFIGGVVSPIGMDSAESLSHADSAMLVAGVTRLASALPNDSAGRFAGLPFVVHAVWRFSIPNGNQVVVGNLARQINQEATPLQERTLLVAERTAADTTLTLGYSERAYGTEDSVESFEVLFAAVLGSSKTPALVVSRDYGDSIAYGLLERGDDGHWRARWSSTQRHC